MGGSVKGWKQDGDEPHYRKCVLGMKLHVHFYKGTWRAWIGKGPHMEADTRDNAMLYVMWAALEHMRSAETQLLAEHRNLAKRVKEGEP